MSTYGSQRSTGAGGLAVLTFLLSSPLLAIWNGFVLKTLWNWFVPSTLPGTPDLSVVEAIGLSLVVSFFVVSRHTAQDDDESAGMGFVRDMVFAVTYGILALLVGAIVHSFM